MQKVLSRPVAPLKHLVSVIKFISERGLAFRGDDSITGSPTNGNYLGIIELIAQDDAFFGEHLKRRSNPGKGQFSYLSNTIMEELISMMAAKDFAEMKTRLRKVKYLSLSVDSTPDAAHTDQLT